MKVIALKNLNVMNSNLKLIKGETYTVINMVHNLLYELEEIKPKRRTAFHYKIFKPADNTWGENVLKKIAEDELVNVL